MSVRIPTDRSPFHVWDCGVDLGYLIMTGVLVAVASEHYNRLLLRPVNSIADIAFLVDSSQRLLKLARERSLESLKHDITVESKPDWFVTDEGDVQWGIEVVDKPKRSISSALSTQESVTLLDPEWSHDETVEISWSHATVSEIMVIGR